MVARGGAAGRGGRRRRRAVRSERCLADRFLAARRRTGRSRQCVLVVVLTIVVVLQ